MTRVFLITSCIELAQYNELLTYKELVEAKAASTNLAYFYFQTLDSFVFPYFKNSNILYSMFLCNRFVFECSEFIRVFDYSKYSITFESMYLLSC